MEFSYADWNGCFALKIMIQILLELESEAYKIKHDLILISAFFL